MVSLPNQAVSNETILLVIKFRIGGSLRFLSHAETLKLFQRACVRAGIRIQHTQGFNPHPKLSLPLPRPVGVEADDDLLCLRLSCSRNEPRLPRAESRGATDYESRIMAGLSEQLPNSLSIVDCQLLIVNGKSQIPKPCSATYILKVQPEYLNERLKVTIRRLLASENLNVQRWRGKEKSKIETCPPSAWRNRKSKFKNVDVRPFLKSIELDNSSIIVQYEISPVGSIRADEILQLLELEPGMLAAPIKRTNVQWQK